ncbi:SUN domain-containing protein 2 [Etheostoma spectabile]|uniref:SUN domain-containing protein 2 n=1 Tax=Etheostoma spectabile TaxID=54343 RepID=UPI0013AEF24B|nr:SUN domain-containing protein 2-like [Etheostoma spectabile]
MARQSDRLLTMGYYDNDEEPRLLYKENPFKVFRKKRGRRNSGGSTVSNMSCMSFGDDICPPPPSNGRGKNISTQFSQKNVVSLLSMVIMYFGGCLYNMYASSRSCFSLGSGWPENMDCAGNELRMMQAQLTKLQEDMVRADVMVVQKQLQELQEEMVEADLKMMQKQLKQLQQDMVGADVKMMKMQLKELQEDMVGADLKIMRKQLKELQEELLRLKKKLIPMADTMPNFALESQGATVLHHLSSDTYHTQPPFVTFWGIPLWYPPATPRTVIQGHSSPLTPGRCWVFAGRRGHVFITLSHPVTITHVTLGHITSLQSPAGFAYSAPREFSVYGVKKVDSEATRLGTFVYDPNGESLQTFKLPGHKKVVFSFVKLQIESNWGHPEYTCVYNFRVHGKMP